MIRLSLVVFTVSLLLACEEETACDRWADYVCACHDDDPEFDCAALRALAEDPAQAVVDQCAIDLQDQEDLDASNGETCDVSA